MAKLVSFFYTVSETKSKDFDITFTSENKKTGDADKNR